MTYRTAQRVIGCVQPAAVPLTLSKLDEHRQSFPYWMLCKLTRMTVTSLFISSYERSGFLTTLGAYLSPHPDTRWDACEALNA